MAEMIEKTMMVDLSKVSGEKINDEERLAMMAVSSLFVLSSGVALMSSAKERGDHEAFESAGFDCLLTLNSIWPKNAKGLAAAAYWIANRLEFKAEWKEIPTCTSSAMN